MTLSLLAENRKQYLIICSMHVLKCAVLLENKNLHSFHNFNRYHLPGTTQTELSELFKTCTQAMPTDTVVSGSYIYSIKETSNKDRLN